MAQTKRSLHRIHWLDLICRDTHPSNASLLLVRSGLSCPLIGWWQLTCEGHLSRLFTPGQGSKQGKHSGVISPAILANTARHELHKITKKQDNRKRVEIDVLIAQWKLKNTCRFYGSTNIYPSYPKIIVWNRILWSFGWFMMMSTPAGPRLSRIMVSQVTSSSLLASTNERPGGRALTNQRRDRGGDWPIRS